MTNYRSLVPGGFYSSTPFDKSIPVSIRCNNAGAINGAAWEKSYPGYVDTVETTPGNKTTIFETPEHGIAVWWDLIRRYRVAGSTTVGDIITRYGGGQNYSAYVEFVTKVTRFLPEHVVSLDDDKTLLPFAKAMFRYECGRSTLPWSDAQILFGFELGRAKGVVADVTPSAPSVPTASTARSWFVELVRAVFAFFKRPAPVPPPSVDFAGRILRAMSAKNYVVAQGADVVNIVYVEGMSPDGTLNDNAPNQFNDLRVVMRVVAGVPSIAGLWEATTEPGVLYTDNPINAKGAARIAFRQFHAWQVGMHRGNHKALIQTGGPVAVHRDANRDFKREGDELDIGYFGINQHGGYDQSPTDIGSASAGCLVGRRMAGHRAFMELVKGDRRYREDNKFVFPTAILSAKEL
jgi:hypothetical protein